MTAVTDNRNDHLLIFSIASENVLEAVAQVVKVSVLADLGLENARLHALSRLRARQVEAAKATTILLEVANLLRSGENIKRRLVPLHHGTTANRRSCLPNTTSQQLFATSVLFIDELAIVIVVLARDHALIVDETSIIGRTEFITHCATEAALRSVVVLNRVLFGEQRCGDAGV